jgi:sugar/nucleoside kinase (ribokinase family)
MALMPTRKPAGSAPKRSKKTDRGGAGKARGEGPRRSPAPTGVFVGVGLATVDLLCVGQRLDERKVELGVFSMQGGGSAANMLAGMAMLGARTRFFGRLSDDQFGRFIRAGLDDLGVDTSAVVDEPRRVSPVSIVMVDELTRKRKILFTRGDTSPLAPRDLPPRLLHGAGMLCIDGYQPALQAAIAEKAREKGITVLLNAGHLDGGMGELLALADIVIGSERFASEFAPSDKIEDSLQEITRLGPRIAVITLGSEGAVATDGKKLVEQKPIDVFVADTTGAGDLFCGAFAYAHACGWPLERALPFASAAAGLQCKSLGARGGLPTLDQVMKAWREGAG